MNDDTAGGVVGERATTAGSPEAQRSAALPRPDAWRMDDDASRRLLDEAPVAILGQRLDGSLSYANPAAARLFGWDRDEMLDRNVEETFIADQNRHRDVEVMGILTAGRSWSGELPLRHHDGTVFPGHVTATLTRDAHGEPDGIVGTVVDLRPIYSARAEVADAEARFRALIERMPLVTYIDELQPAESTTYVSPQIEELLGYPRDRFLGSEDFFLSIVHPEDRERVQAVMGAGRIADAGKVLEYRLIAADGRIVWIHDQDTLVRDRAGKPLHIEGYWFDITERKEAEAAREATAELYRRERRDVEDRIGAAERRYRGLVEQLPVATYMFLLDEQSTPIYVSPQIERIFGYPAEQWLSDPTLWTRLVHPADRGRVLASTSKANSSGSGLRLEYRAVTRDGRTIWVRDESVVVMDEAIASGEPVARGYIADITEEKEAADSIRRGQLLESLSLLAGGVAHDFNNLLTAMMGYADLVAEMLSPESPAREPVAEIGQAAERAATLAQQMLAYSGRGRFAVERTDLAELVMNVTRPLRQVLPPGVRMREEIATDVPPADVDAKQIGQVVENLVVNAAEALADEGGAIHVEVGMITADRALLSQAPVDDGLEPGQYVSISVSDTGIGMDPEVQAHIFDPFFPSKLPSRGLGLPAVLGIVRRHHGAVIADAAPEGGSRFRILLHPAHAGADADAPNAAVRTPVPMAPDRGRARILIVDDEESVRAVTARMVQSRGMTSVTASSAEEALELVRTNPDAFDACLLDVVMPGISGSEAIRAIQGERPDLPIVVMSGYGTLVLEGTIAELGIAGFVDKPFTPDRIAEALLPLVDATLSEG